MRNASWEQNLTVADLLLPERGEWNVELIRLVLPFEEPKIRSIRPSVSGAPDKLSWIGSASGNYTTKSGYATTISQRRDVMEISQEDLSFEWKKAIWNLKTSPKTNLFAWKVLHGAILAREALRARQINVDGKCKRCNQPETIEHLFFHCAFAKQIWSSAPVFPSVEYNDSIARNNLVFNDRPLSAQETLSKAITLAREWGACKAKAPATTHGLSPPTRTPSNCVVIKSNAAWNESSNIAGLGWIVKAHNRASSFSCLAHYVRTPLAAEALALREAIWKCRELGLTRIKCESECAELVKAINKKMSLAGLYGILADIQDVALSFECISFVWIFRSKNIDTDLLAKQVLSVELALMAATTFV
ncbi:hypothetical protein F2Q69_00030794 [Brassica cretica]|uniref:Reverse transcriptase zinc-binding domain-containing protein n=1 Tax=Brassica cretica TaxID=69181 RepID=A0A8S9RW95_BRACR|nr:hypothetical protein F2Q69_00030794 [Brassica cretica]